MIKGRYQPVWFNPKLITCCYVEYGEAQHNGYGTPGYQVIIETPAGSKLPVTRAFATDTEANDWMEAVMILEMVGKETMLQKIWRKFSASKT